MLIFIPKCTSFSAAVGNSICITWKGIESASPLTCISGSEGSLPTPGILLQTRCTVSSTLLQIFSPSSHCTSLTPWIPPPTPIPMPHPSRAPAFPSRPSALLRIAPGSCPQPPSPSPGDTHLPRSVIQRAHPPGRPGSLRMNEGHPATPSLWTLQGQESISSVSWSLPTGCKLSRAALHLPHLCPSFPTPQLTPERLAHRTPPSVFAKRRELAVMHQMWLCRHREGIHTLSWAPRSTGKEARG